MEESENDANPDNFKRRPWWETRESSEMVSASKSGEREETGKMGKSGTDEITDREDEPPSGKSTNIRACKSSGLMSIYNCVAQPLDVGDAGFCQAGEQQALAGIFPPEEDAAGRDIALTNVKYQSWLEMDEILLDDSGEDEDDGGSKDYLNKNENGYPINLPADGEDEQRDYKTPGLMNVYRSAVVPIEVGCLKLTMEESVMETGESGTEPMSSVRVDWNGDGSSPRAPSSAVSPPRVNSGSSAGTVNRARASAIIRRRQQRRHSHKRKGYMANCINIILTALYFSGFSPYRPKTAWKPPKPVAVILKIVYWTITTIAIIQLLFQLKTNWIDFQMDHHVGKLPPLGMSVVNLAARIYYIKAFLGSKDKLDQLLNTTNESAARVEENSQKKKIQNIAIGSMLAVSLLMALLSVAFGGVPLKRWSISLSWNFQVIETGQQLLVWNPNSWDDATKAIFERYAYQGSPEAIALATLGCVLTFFGTLHEYLFVDVWMLLACQVYVSQLDLCAARCKVRSSQSGSDFSELWDLYMERRAISDNINDIFNPALKVMHVANILRFSDFVLDYLENDAEIMRVTNFVVLIKLSITYWMCRRSANNNDKLCELIVETSDAKGLIQINGEEMNFQLLLKEMEFHPIGFGQGSFLVEEGFLIKMLCVAWSVVLVVVDHPLDTR